MIRTYMRPEDRCAGLIPEDCVTPGVWQRSFGLGGGRRGDVQDQGATRLTPLAGRLLRRPRVNLLNRLAVRRGATGSRA